MGHPGFKEEMGGTMKPVRCIGADPKSILQPTCNASSLHIVNDSLPPCAAENCQQAELCPLNRVKAGTSVRIKQLSASPEVSHRLREMAAPG